MSEEEFTSPEGNDPQELPEPDLADGAEAPDAPEASQYDAEPQPEKQNAESPEVTALKSQVTELTMKIERLIELHENDFRDAEQKMQIQRLQEQVEQLGGETRRAYPDSDSDPVPMPYIWLGADNGTVVTEQAANSNSIVPYTEGRTFASTAALTLASTHAFFADLIDLNGGGQVVRRVKLSDGAGSTATPKQIGDSVLGSEAADTITWSIAADNKAVNAWIETRQRYYSSGDKKWYAYARLYQFDSKGKLYSIGDEKRFVVEAPDDCSGGTTPAAFFSF